MAKKPKRASWFKLWLHHRPLIDAVPDDVAGRAVKAALNYFATGEVVQLGQLETLLQFQPSMQEPDKAELENLQNIVREAVAHIWEDSIRDTIEAVYWEGESVTAFAARHSICKQAASERLQKGYAILRKNKKIVSLAIAQGYDIDYYRRKTLSAFRTDGVSSVESAVIYQEKMKRRREGLYKHLGNLLGRGIDSLENGTEK